MEKKRKQDLIPLHLGKTARQKRLLSNLPEILSPSSNVPCHLVTIRDELRRTIETSKNELFHPIEELIKFVQNIGKLVYAALSNGSKSSLCVMKTTLNSRLVQSLFIPWLQVGGLESEEDGMTWFTTDMRVLDRSLTECSFYADVRTPARRVFFSCDPAEQDMLAAMDKIPPGHKINAADMTNAAGYKAATKLELGADYPDDYDTRGRKPALSVLKNKVIAKRCKSARKEGIKEAFRVIVDQTHRFQLCFKKPTIAGQTLVIQFFIDGVTYIRREGHPIDRDSVPKFL
jgi:hypothetical protein